MLERGSVVVAKDPARDKGNYVLKRVTGIAGDQIQVADEETPSHIACAILYSTVYMRLALNCVWWTWQLYGLFAGTSLSPKG